MEHPLRTYRRQNRVSLGDLSTLVNVSMSSLSRIETRRQYPSRDLAIRIAAVTGIDVRLLLDLPIEEPAE